MDNIKPLIPAKPRLVTTGNSTKTFYINPDTQVIAEASTEISDSDSFVSFCHRTGLSWFLEFWPDLKKFSETFGEYAAYGNNAYIEAAKMHGLVVGKIGDASYMIAKSTPVGDEKNFCTTRNFNKQIFWGSAIIFSVETYYPGGYTVIQQQDKTSKPTLFNQRDCYLSLDQVEALFNFSCEPVENADVIQLQPKNTPTTTKDLIVNRNLQKVASINEVGEVVEDASVQSLGVVIPGAQQALRNVSLSTPKFYGDVLIQLGLVLKGDPQANFFNIPFDMSLVSKPYPLPDYVFSVLKDLTVKLTNAGNSEE